MGAKLKTIKISGFRGFNSETEIPLDEVVLVYGLNGSGKSSFAEAIEWLFFDDISRRRLSPCPGEYTSGLYLKNLYTPPAIKSFVEVVLEKDGKNYTLRKELESERSSKQFIDGTKVSSFETVLPEFKNHHRPILAQVEISALVNTEQKERWEQLAKILGQEELTILREHLIDLRANKKDPIYKKDEESFKGLCHANESFSFPREFVENFESLNLHQFESVVHSLLLKENITNDSLENGIKTIISRLSGTELGRQLALLEPVKDSENEKSIRSLEEGFNNLSELAQRSAGGRLSPIQTVFFEAGGTLAKIPQCPFCLQETLTQKRLQEIKNQLETDKDSISAKKELDESIHRAPLAFHNDCGFDKLIPAPDQLKIIAQKLSDMKFDEFASKTKQFSESVQRTTKDSSNQLKLLYNGYIEALNKYYLNKDTSVDISATKEALVAATQDIGIKMHDLNEEWGKLRDKILLRLPQDSESQGQEMRKWIQVERCYSFIRDKRYFSKKYYLIEGVTQSIQKKLEAFEKAEVAKLLKSHSDEIRQYYEELNPGETVSFKKIEVSGGQRRQARLVAADSDDKEINPVTIFSEAHINSLSLSIYFPQRVDRNPVWDVIILDDPVQSMDENHSRSLIEILVKKASESNKQVIVLTHARNFADDFYYRIKGVKPTTYYEFIDNQKESSTIIIKFGATLTYLDFVRKNRNGSSVMRESAANALRKSIEAVIGEILIANGRTLAQVEKWTKEGLSQMFDQFERVQKIKPDDVAKLRSLISEGHGGSHAFPLRDTTPGGLLRGSQNVEEVYQAYIK